MPPRSSFRFREKKSVAKPFIAIAVALSASPAFAQRQVEFGYKDRIFEQNYLLPENVSALDARAVVVMLALRLPGSRDLRLISAMGGQCGATFVHDNDAESSSWPKATPTQVALDRLPFEARVRQPEPDPVEEMKRPATLDEACVLQEILFGKAYRDSLSTESQLASLAKSMRRRFARSWVPPEKMKDPAWLLGVERLSLISSRAHRILRVDPTKLEPGKQTVAEMIAGYMDMDMAAFEAALAEWDALEAEVLAEAQARLETVKAREREEQQRRQAEAAERQAKQARAEEDERARREARRAEEAAREEARRAQEAERVRRVREERARQLAGHTGPGTVPAAPSSQLQASLQPTPQEMPLQGQDADRLAQVRRLEARQAELERTIARLEGRLAHQQGAVLRNPLNLQGALTSIAGISQARADLDQAQAERRDVTRALQRLRKAAAVSQAAVATRSEPVVAVSDGECRLGGQCQVIALTLFCRTPQQMAAILSQRPGPARKQVLSALTASDDCRQVSAGQLLQWTAPITSIQPKGESMAELVPGSLADGTQGFMLKDGVIAR